MVCKNGILLVLVISILALTGIAEAVYSAPYYTATFQTDPNLGQVGSDFTCSYVTCPEYIHNTTGGNSYIYGESWWISTAHPLQMTYSAATALTTGWYTAQLAGDCIVGNLPNMAQCGSPPCRFEVKGSGSNFWLYLDGVAQYQFAPAWILCNPTNVYWGQPYSYTPGTYDDIIWGDTASKYVLDVPEGSLAGGIYMPLYQIKRNLGDPNLSGFYKISTDTLISNRSFTTSFSKNDSVNQTLEFQTYVGAVTYQTRYTGSVYAGTTEWNVTEFLEQNPPTGYYRLHLSGTTAYSEPILYIIGGAVVFWDQEKYSGGDSAIISYTIPETYWNLSESTYRLDIMDIYGTVSKTYSLAVPNGTLAYTFDSDATGVYIATVTEKPISGGNDTWLGTAYAELTNSLIVSGYVYAYTESAISSASLNFTQAGISTIMTSDPNGYYIISNLTKDAPLTINVTYGYLKPYNYSFTPRRAGSMRINFTLESLEVYLTPDSVIVGGIFRDKTYGNPIPDATITLRNETTGNTTVVTTNKVGYYSGENLENGLIYNVWGYKSGYWNSSTYQVTANGSYYSGSGGG